MARGLRNGLLYLLLIVSAEGIRIDAHVRSSKRRFGGKEKRDTSSPPPLSLVELDDAERRTSVSTKFVFVTILAVSVVCSVGFTMWKHKYHDWEARVDSETLEKYDKELLKYTEEAKRLIDDMKRIVQEATGMNRHDVANLDDALEKQSKRLAFVHGEEEIETAEREGEDGDLFSSQEEASRKAEELSFAYKAFALTRKAVEKTVFLTTVRGGASAIGEASFNAAGSIFGGAFLLVSIIRGVHGLRQLSAKLKRAKLNCDVAASNARSEGQKVLAHARWATCMVIGNVYAALEGHQGGEEGEAQRLVVAFRQRARSFWEANSCEQFLAHEFVRGDRISWMSGEAATRSGVVATVTPGGLYRMDDGEDVTQTNIALFDPSVGRIGPIRGHGVVENVAVSSDCFGTAVSNVADRHHLNAFEPVCSRRFDTGGQREVVCELNKTPKGGKSLDSALSKALESCTTTTAACADERARASRVVVRAFERYDCTPQHTLKRFDGRDKSRILLLKRSEPVAGDERSLRAIYKIDLHSMYVNRKGDWASVVAGNLLSLPGWVTPDKYPVVSHLVPNWMSHLYRYAKRSVMPNPNLDAVALMRGVDYELVHYLAPRWTLLDAKREYARHRCGADAATATTVGHVPLRWLSVCAEAGVAPNRHANKFRKQFARALANERSRDSGTTAYAPILPDDAIAKGSPVLIYWRQGDEAVPAFLRSTLEGKDVPGPCYMLGRIERPILRVTTDPNADEPYFVRVVKIYEVPMVCGSFDGETGTLVVPPNGDLTVRIPLRLADRYVEAALALEMQPCLDAFGNGLGCKGRGAKQTIKRVISLGYKGKKQFSLRFDRTARVGGEGMSVVVGKYVKHGRVGFGKDRASHSDREWKQEHSLEFRMHFDDETIENVRLYPAEAVVAAVTSDPNVARGARIAVAADKVSGMRGTCALNSLSSLSMGMYEACVSRLLNEPNEGVDDQPGWYGRTSEYKLVSRHEVLPDLRFLGSSKDTSMFAFQARKSSVSIEQPPIRDLRLTLSRFDSPDPATCPFDTTCEKGETCKTPIVRDDARAFCNWWRVTTSFGDGTGDARRHEMYLWVKRRFAIDPCEISKALGGWLPFDEANETDRVRKAWCSVKEKAAR